MCRLVFDFDQQGKVYEDFKAQVPTELFDQLVVETSQSGGKHVIIRLDCPIGKGTEIDLPPKGGGFIRRLKARLFV